MLCVAWGGILISSHCLRQFIKIARRQDAFGSEYGVLRKIDQSHDQIDVAAALMEALRVALPLPRCTNADHLYVVDGPPSLY
jgi:hypothetical protein